MKLSSRVKPISYLKAHAADIVREMESSSEPLVITQRGEAKAVLQDIRSFESTQETLALLKILALGERQLEAGKVQRASDVFKRLRAGSSRS
jgi:prevent-host-death family protein